MSLLIGEYRGSITKGGPRVLSFVPTLAGDVLANCPTCDARWTPATVLGEDYAGGADPGAGGQPLVLGWYELQTEVDVYWAQVNPADACSVDPFFQGRLLRAGGCTVIYVDAADRDGILVLKFCSVTPATTCGGSVSGLARVNRSDTILTMSETGESAAYQAAPASRACQPPPSAGGSGGTG